MQLHNKLALFAMLAWPVALAAQDLPAPPADLPTGEGPRGTSQSVPGKERFDQVGYAALAPVGGPGTIYVTSRQLPAGSFVEVTALDTGKTIAAVVSGDGPDAPGRVIGLSAGAAQALGVDAVAGQAAVRVRAIDPAQPDQAALRAGSAGVDRLPAPPVLLTALRKRLPPLPAALASTTPLQPRRGPVLHPQPAVGASYPLPVGDAPPPFPHAAAPVKKPAPRATATVASGAYAVQVAALANAERAQALAQQLGGKIVAGGGLYRVRLGPYRDRHGAELARDAVARRGYAEARIVANP